MPDPAAYVADTQLAPFQRTMSGCTVEPRE
jgi:hypothetical protein